LLGQLDTFGRALVADFEAGLGTVLRMGDRPVDVVVVVAEPTTTSLEVARRAADVVAERKLGRLVVTANRVRDDTDVERVRSALPGLDVVVVPEDPAILAAERRGQAPLDAAPEAPGVRALVTLARSLLPVPG
jgi:CO dehydrogenase maturation factor